MSGNITTLDSKRIEKFWAVETISDIMASSVTVSVTSKVDRDVLFGKHLRFLNPFKGLHLAWEPNIVESSVWGDTTYNSNAAVLVHVYGNLDMLILTESTPKTLNGVECERLATIFFLDNTKLPRAKDGTRKFIFDSWSRRNLLTKIEDAVTAVYFRFEEEPLFSVGWVKAKDDLLETYLTEKIPYEGYWVTLLRNNMPVAEATEQTA